ncbi:hypothetical protein [Actinacidiphila acidipaludis]|uniref:hypothetical protein n=1 Tax=Actinacidiphila acidipaludis TaxID=2873382 RepID=UPI00223A8121|nr:hypothetical protein [Streptomyces acidipaludis]
MSDEHQTVQHTDTEHPAGEATTVCVAGTWDPAVSTPIGRIKAVAGFGRGVFTGARRGG